MILLSLMTDMEVTMLIYDIVKSSLGVYVFCVTTAVIELLQFLNKLNFFDFFCRYVDPL